LIVDTHIHPISDDPRRYPLAPEPTTGPDWYTNTHFTAEECLDQVAVSGVDRVVLVSSISAYGYDNRYAADAAARYPDRFVSVCRIDPLAPGAPDTLTSWIEGYGMQGVRLGSADPQGYPTCERARQLGIPVALQVPGADLRDVRQLVARFPDVKVILDHLAHPDVEDGPPYAAAAEFFALAECPNLYLKFSSMNIREADRGKSTPRAFLEALVTRFGSGRLMWGSDFPHSTGSPAAPYRELVDLAREALAFLSPTDREQVLAGTALSLYPALLRVPGPGR